MSLTIEDVERVNAPYPADALKPVHYPDSDGNRMADNTRQFRYIATLKGGFDNYYRQRDDVFVAGDLLWYPIEGDNKTRYAPDVMIAFGRPPGDRGSYKQWEENNQPPNVVFEVMSPGNTAGEMANKLHVYDRLGVDEYYVYDPDRGELSGWIRNEAGGGLEEIADMQGWQSPLTQVTFRLDGDHLEVMRPDGEVFLTPVEMGFALDAERQRADEERQRADVERQRAEASELRAASLAERLRKLGIDPDEGDQV
ncbi:MAG: Uma2 family endonuclease [Verrucomicrobiales bacterium]